MNTAENVPNRLINEKSPYLLQHAYNPVDWFPWCEGSICESKGGGQTDFFKHWVFLGVFD